MPPRVTQADERLIAAYSEAALRISRMLQGASPRQRAVLLARVDGILAELDALAAEYVEQELPLHFKEGSEEAVRELRNLAGFSDVIDATFGTLHVEAMEALAEDAAVRFATSLESIRESSRRVFRRAEREQLLRSVIASEVEGAANPAKIVRAAFDAKGIIKVRINTREWDPEVYAATITHSLLSDAHNTGSAMRYIGNGLQYGRRIERADCCEICKPFRDRIIWLGDRRLRAPSHPFCYGALAPFTGEPPADDPPIMGPEDKRLPEKTRRYILKL